ncbi:TPA: hypothetical protein I7272_24000 [Vibrio parahaemolyticus]|nr:hypothetical protein [Vibrio parahaemolyticus]HAS6696107.1 hypothetical protein [Vibrio parahaemolyticus]
MNEYVTHGQLVEIIELFDVNAVIVVLVYDLARYLLGKLVDYFN